MGTVSFDGLFAGMRKPQDFIVYPMKHAESAARIQSDKKAGFIKLDTGAVLLSSNQYDFTNIKRVGELSPEELLNFKAAVMSTASARAGSHGITSDNKGALEVFNNPAVRKNPLEAARAAYEKALGGVARAKNPAPRIGTARPKRVSQITKKAPSKRLVARRRKNTDEGYFPNPTADTVRDNMLVKMLNGAIEQAQAHKKKKDYANVNGYLGYAQGLIDTMVKVRAMDKETAAQYRKAIKGLTL